jgi:hypothetical protein
MGQLGRYTTYVGGGASPAHALLATLYPGSPFAKMLSNGDETKAQAAVFAVATSDPGQDPNGGGIQPKGGVQAGDLGMFPTGVDLTFKGSPDVSKVKWTNPGDPANGYIPDVTSPTAGPGHTAGADKTGDPTGTIPQLVATATTSDPGSQTSPFNEAQGTRDPSNDGPAVAKNNALGQPQTKGDSGGNV